MNKQKYYPLLNERVPVVGCSSEVLMHFGLADKPIEIALVRSKLANGVITPMVMSQVYSNGRAFSAPVTTGEGGFYQDLDGYYYTYLDRTRAQQEFPPRKPADLDIEGTTFFLIKPDAVKRCLIGALLRMLEERGFEVINLTMKTLTPRDASELYTGHADQEWYEPLLEFTTSGPCVFGLARLKQGQAVKVLRELVGPAHPRLAGTIRGELMREGPLRENLIHSSDSRVAVKREAAVFGLELPAAFCCLVD